MVSNSAAHINQANASLALLRMLQLADPALPIGGFSHSAGLETYVQEGIVHDAVSAEAFIEQMLKQNLQYTDGAFASLSYDAAAANGIDKIFELDNECNAVKLPMEMREASKKLGLRLSKIFQPLFQHELIEQYSNALKKKQTEGHYSIAFGLYAQAMSIEKLTALSAFYYNAVAGMTTNAVKLVPLSQQAGQELLFSLHETIHQIATDTMSPDKNLIGMCCSGFDIRSMQHERLYSRLYMS